MQFFDTFLTCYGWEGIALAGAVLAMFGVQLYYYIFVYGRIPGYKNNRRPAVLEADPQVSVVIPLFSEDYSFVEERLPLILAQNYPDFEVVIVYVGHDSDFYEELVRLKQSFRANHVDLYDNLNVIPFDKIDGFFKNALK